MQGSGRGPTEGIMRIFACTLKKIIQDPQSAQSVRLPDSNGTLLTQERQHCCQLPTFRAVHKASLYKLMLRVYVIRFNGPKL